MKKRTNVDPTTLAVPVSRQEGISLETGGHPRRVYRSPRLQCFGDIRTLTLGGSPGFSDSSVEPQNMLM